MPSQIARKPKLACTHCGEHNVNPRRKSSSGNHWCSNHDCQLAKSRHYAQVSRNSAREAKAALARDDSAIEIAEAKVAFFQFLEASYAPRSRCPECGLNEAIEGYPHFAADGAPCFGTRPNSLPESQSKHLHPDMIRIAIAAPTYEES